VGPQPEALHRVDVDLLEAVAILVAGVLARRVVDRPVPIAPLGQASVDGILVGVDFRPGRDGPKDQRFDGGLAHVVGHADDDLARPLDHAENGRLLARPRAALPGTLQPTAARVPTGGCDLFQQALVSRDHVGLVALDHALQDHGILF